MRHLKLLAAGLLGAALSFFSFSGTARAADHGDAPNVDNDSGADIADLFAFLDPNDNSKVCIVGTFHGFIVPGEAPSFAAFDPNVLYRFAIENTGDAKPDEFIDLTFSERTANNAPQTATIKLPNGRTFTAPTTPPSVSATPNPQTITTDPTSGVSFFGGEADDPFFFDLVAFNRFVATVKAGHPDASLLTRGRDVFAGYNVVGMALDIPKALLTGKKNAKKIGVEFMTLRRTQTAGASSGLVRSSGKFRQVDRMGNPAVNVALIPFNLKSAFNTASPVDDAKGRFKDAIVASLAPFGTDAAHVGILASVAITTGDYLRLDLTIPNSGNGGGDNAAASYPNGRRLKDDTVDIILTIINNGNALGDNVNASDVPPQNQFPFLALPQQPRDPGVIDDNTRN